MVTAVNLFDKGPIQFRLCYIFVFGGHGVVVSSKYDFVHARPTSVARIA